MNSNKRSRRANVRRAVGSEQQPAKKAVRKPFKVKEQPTSEPRRRRRAAPADPAARPPGFPLPYVHPEKEA